MNNNFWFLFTQLISKLAKMHGETDTTIKNRERHLQKLQHGQSLVEKNKT